MVKSKGHQSLLAVLQELFPKFKIEEEKYVGERLFLDMYIPHLRVGLEYHGRQHFEFVEHYHKDLPGFRKSQERDQRKIELCHQQGIAVAVFTDADTLDRDTVQSRLVEALNSAPQPEEVAASPKSIEEQAKEVRRQRRREAYRRWKEKMRDERRGDRS